MNKKGKIEDEQIQVIVVELLLLLLLFVIKIKKTNEEEDVLNGNDKIRQTLPRNILHQIKCNKSNRKQTQKSRSIQLNSRYNSLYRCHLIHFISFHFTLV